MLLQLVRRTAQGGVVLLMVTAFTFFLVNLAPGGPSSVMRMGSTAEERAALIARLGLDRPLHVQYADWLGGIVRGDFGRSLTGGDPVGPLVAERLANTVQLGLVVFALLVVFGTILGIAAALARGGWPDFVINLVSTIGMSVPDFWFGIMAIFLFAVELGWLPPSSTVDSSSMGPLELLPYLVLPVGVLSFSLAPNVIRYARSAMLEALGADYVRTARSKGLGTLSVVGKHALRNALITVVAMLALLLPVLLSGTVVVETVFGWPGLGRLAVEAAMHRNYPIIMAVTVVSGAIVIATNILVDAVYMMIDPRIAHA